MRESVKLVIDTKGWKPRNELDILIKLGQGGCKVENNTNSKVPCFRQVPAEEGNMHKCLKHDLSITAVNGKTTTTFGSAIQAIKDEVYTSNGRNHRVEVVFTENHGTILTGNACANVYAVSLLEKHIKNKLRRPARVRRACSSLDFNPREKKEI